MPRLAHLTNRRRLYECSICLIVLLFVLGIPRDVWGARSSPFQVVEATDRALVLDFVLPELREGRDITGQTVITFDGATIPHDGHAPTGETAGPMLPQIAATVGIPPDSIPSVTIVSEQVERVPLSRFPSFRDALNAASRPRARPVAEVEAVGYARDQYLARLLFRPVSLSGDSLRVIRSSRLRITFSEAAAAPAFGAEPLPASAPFEGMFRDILVNYEQARKWRWNRVRPRMAPAVPDLREGQNRLKLLVSERGIYRITPFDIERAGFDPRAIDPTTFRLTYRGDEVGIDVLGVEDGIFDGNDLILFYGEIIGHDRFTTQNAYMLTWGGNAGIRPNVKDGSLAAPAPQRPRAFRTTKFYERDRLHDPLPEVRDERADHYFWTGFTGGLKDRSRWTKRIPLRFPTEANDIPEPATLRIAFQGARGGSARHTMQIRINSETIDESSWIGQTVQFREIEFSQSFIGPDTDLFLIALDRNGTPDGPNINDIYLDWFEMEYWRTFRYTPGGVLVSTDTYPALSPGPVRFDLDDFPSGDVFVYELTDIGIISRIQNLTRTPAGDGTFRISFEDEHRVPSRYMVLTRNDLRRPDEIRSAPLSDIKSPANAADYVIISHRDFIDALRPLVEYRRAQGHDVKVIDVESIYNEFNHGVFNPFAIQSFLRFAFQVWARPPQYVLLVGDAQYDYKNAETTARNLYPIYVPTIHSWSDPWGETAMDHRFVTIHGNDPLPDMFIGRFPVQRPSEVTEITQKIIAYETSPDIGPWRGRIVQAADDDLTNIGDRIFQQSREKLIQDVIPPEYDVQRIYLKTLQTSGRTKRAIKQAFQDGALIFEYAGHGGRTVWADEDILRSPDLPSLVNGHRQPLVVATTCEMNFFDKPERLGERAMGEEFILGTNRGAIATIGATRLTFAQCNVIFDNFFFRSFLLSPETDVGRLLAQAKTENMIADDSPHCLPGLEQYTLFGDPALRLARPSLRSDLQLESLAVNPGQKVHLLQGSLALAFTDPPQKAIDFDGEMLVSVIYPNNLDQNPANDLPIAQKKVPVVGGEYGDVEFTVPGDAKKGDALIRIDAQSPNKTAIGGRRFSVRQSRVANVAHRREGNTLVVTADVENPRGVQGIRKVEIRWWNNEDYRTRVEAMRHQDGSRFVTAQALPLPGLGKRISYAIIVTDVSGTVTETTDYAFEMPLGPDLAIAELGRTKIPELSYGFDRVRDQWVFRTTLTNLGDQRPAVPTEVVIVEGNADVDANRILDPEANVLARATVPVDAWKAAPPDSGRFEQAEIVLPLKDALTSGVHEITVWVDPETVDDPHDDGISGKVEESRENNNRTQKPFEITDFVIGKATTEAFSLDRTLDMTVPAGAAEPTTLSISLLPPPGDSLFEGRDAPYLRVPLPRLTNRAETAFGIKLQSGERRLRKPASLTMAFDFSAMRERIAAELGLPPSPQDRTTPQRQLLDETADKALERVAIYHWLEDRNAWRRLDATLQRDPDGRPKQSIHVTPPVANTGRTHDLRIVMADVDATSAPTGRWMILFVTPTEYQVLFMPDGASQYQQLPARGKLDVPYADSTVALRALLVRNGNPNAPANQPSDPAEVGEAATFDTVTTDEGLVAASNFRSANVGDGSVSVFLRDTVTLTNAPYGDWILFMTGPNRYEVRDGNGVPLMNNAGRIVRGNVGVDLLLVRLGFTFRVLQGSQPFEFGDTFRIRVGRVMTIKAMTREMGVFTLLQDRDAQPPSVQLWVDGTTPQNGEVIPPRPTITLLISDRNGVDTDTFRYEIEKLGEDGFRPVKPDTVTLNPKPIDQVSVHHRPILFIGTYTFRVYVKDLAGTPATSDDGPFEDFVFSVDEDPDLEPPSLALATEDGPLKDGQTLLRSPQTLILNIRDSHAIDMDTVQVSIARRGQEPIPVEDFETDFDRRNPSVARITWKADLTNGDYDVYAKVEDTSTNVGFLGPEERTPLRFSLDEPVHFEGSVLNAPNPFSPFDPITRGTYFTYTLSQPSDRVTIRIYSVAGRLVRVIDDASGERGYNETYWDGRDSEGRLVANGTYFYKVRAESVFQDNKRREERTGKLAVIR